MSLCSALQKSRVKKKNPYVPVIFLKRHLSAGHANVPFDYVNVFEMSLLQSNIGNPVLRWLKTVSST